MNSYESVQAYVLLGHGIATPVLDRPGAGSRNGSAPMGIRAAAAVGSAKRRRATATFHHPSSSILV